MDKELKKYIAEQVRDKVLNEDPLGFKMPELGTFEKSLMAAEKRYNETLFDDIHRKKSQLENFGFKVKDGKAYFEGDLVSSGDPTSKNLPSKEQLREGIPLTHLMLKTLSAPSIETKTKDVNALVIDLVEVHYRNPETKKVEPLVNRTIEKFGMHVVGEERRRTYDVAPATGDRSVKFMHWNKDGKLIETAEIKFEFTAKDKEEYLDEGIKVSRGAYGKVAPEFKAKYAERESVESGEMLTKPTTKAELEKGKEIDKLQKEIDRLKKEGKTGDKQSSHFEPELPNGMPTVVSQSGVLRRM
jgi:hypothetical protein